MQVEAIDDRIIDALEEAEEYNEEHGNTVPVRGVVVNAVCTSSIEGPFDYNMDLSGERAGAFSAHIGNLADQFDYGGMESGAWGIGESDANGPGTGGPAGDGYGRGSDNPNRTCSVTVSIRDDSHDSKAAETEDVEEDSPQPETRDEQDPQTEEMPDVWEIESGPSEGPEEMPVGEDEAPDDGLVRRAEDCLEQIDRVAEPGRQYRSVQLQDCMNAYRSTRRDVSYNAYHGEGASVREIADDLGVSTSTVYRDLKAMATVHGETAPSVHLADCRENRMQFAYEAKEMGSCVREIAESLGVSKSTVYRDLTRAREEIGAVGKAD
ncbi:helix-turn-helix domain-containing protein [Candidatus Woesearchaeota archaeon]|nr:helix-turn-helix domain-containing protein [Candidatus Woesearchaeota archaeon]